MSFRRDKVIKKVSKDAVIDAGYKNLKEFCDKHGLSISAVRMHDYSCAKKNKYKIYPVVELILKNESLQNELSKYKSILKDIR